VQKIIATDLRSHEIASLGKAKYPATCIKIEPKQKCPMRKTELDNKNASQGHMESLTLTGPKRSKVKTVSALQDEYED